jgi:hypothetical protein
MAHNFQRVVYQSLNARQQESYNFQKIAAILADYGFTAIRLSDDWCCADFIAQHMDGSTFLKVQLKGRLSFGKKYLGRDIHIAFPADGHWFIYPHDALLSQVQQVRDFSDSKAWSQQGLYHFPYLTPVLQGLLEPYRLSPSA